MKMTWQDTKSFLSKLFKGAAESASLFIYHLLWWTSLPASFVSFRSNQKGLPDFVASLLAFTSACLIGVIYLDMRRIEKLRGEDHDYPYWAGCQRKPELVLRILIVIFLLFAVGEFHVAQQAGDKLLTSLQSFVANSNWLAIFVQTERPIGLTSLLDWLKNSHVFVVGSFGAFTLITCWNVAAFKCRLRHFTTNETKLKSRPREEYGHYLAGFFRIGFFAIIGAISSCYWLVVWVFSDHVRTFTIVFVVVYYVSVILLMFISNPHTGRKFDRGVARVFPN